jgi:hypothetical protein
MHRGLGDLQVVAGAVQVADAGAGDDRGNRQHDVAEGAEVLGPERRLGPIDHGTRGVAVGGGADHRAEDPLQQMQRDGGPACQRQSPLQ